MALSTHTIVRILPLSRADGARTRGRATISGTDDAASVDDEPHRTDLVPHPTARPHQDREAAKPSVPGTLAAQLIAQKVPGKSDRRLARLFPERVHDAYAQAAQTAPGVQSVRRA